MTVATGKRPKAAIVQKKAVDQASAFLKDLPEKPKETFSLREAVNQLREQIQAVLAKGYSYDEVATILRTRGVEISASTLKNYVPSGRRQPKDPDAVKSTRGRRSRKEEDAGATLESAEVTTDSDAVEPQSNGSTPADTTQTSTGRRGRRKSTAAEPEAPAAPKRGRGRAKSATAAKSAPESRTTAATADSEKPAGTRGRRTAKKEAPAPSAPRRGRKKNS